MQVCIKNALSRVLNFMIVSFTLTIIYTLPQIAKKCKRAHENSRNLYMNFRIHFMQINMHNCVDFFRAEVYNIDYNRIIMTTYSQNGLKGNEYGTTKQKNAKRSGIFAAV